MGNRVEEKALAQHMPESFKTRCPLCKTPWTVNTVDGKVQLECRACDHDQVIQAKAARWWANSGCYVSEDEWAWQKLWRSFVMSVALSRAIQMCGN